MVGERAARRGGLSEGMSRSGVLGEEGGADRSRRGGVSG